MTTTQRATYADVLAAPRDRVPVAGGSSTSPRSTCPILQRRTEVYRLTEERRWLQLAVYEDATKVHAEPFEAIELDLGGLWAPTRP